MESTTEKLKDETNYLLGVQLSYDWAIEKYMLTVIRTYL